MAVDTRQGRFSVMTLVSRAIQGPGMPLFEADGTVDLDDRQHLLGLYSGIVLTGLVFTVDPENVFTIAARSTVFSAFGRPKVWTHTSRPNVWSLE